MFEDLETFRPQLEAAAARASLTLADAEALFVYTYELYEPTISPVADLPAKKLSKVLKKLKVSEDCIAQLAMKAIDGAAIMDQRNASVDISIGGSTSG